MGEGYRVLFAVFFLLLSILSTTYSTFDSPSEMMQAVNGGGDGNEMHGIRAELVHVDAHLNITPTQGLQRALHRSNRRLQSLELIAVVGKIPENDPTDLEAPLSRDRFGGEFVMNVSIGTPPSPMPLILDTGSDISWVQCSCANIFCFLHPIFNFRNSSTYARVGCNSASCSTPKITHCTNSTCSFRMVYGDGSYSIGELAVETFTLSNHRIPTVTFGCAMDGYGYSFMTSSGLVGMGRGSFSFLSQIGGQFRNIFSYCLVDSASKSSPIFFGHHAEMDKEGMRSTPLVPNKKVPSLYYVSVEGISVGGRKLSIPESVFDIQANGTGGFIFDSGTVVTRLVHGAYSVVRDELESFLVGLERANGSEVGLDLCFKAPPADQSLVEFPTVTFHFDGADYDLPRDNYMIPTSNNTLLCLAMLPSNANGLSIFGNVQQQNHHILYDLGNNRLSFKPVACDSL